MEELERLRIQNKRLKKIKKEFHNLLIKHGIFSNLAFKRQMRTDRLLNIQKAKKEACPEALYSLATRDCYATESWQSRVKMLKLAAASGHEEAAEKLSQIYKEGERGVKYNPTMEEYWEGVQLCIRFKKFTPDLKDIKSYHKELILEGIFDNIK